ncbi:hypothetical protein [Methylobacterium sp. CM6257]
MGYETVGERVEPLFTADPRTPAEHANLAELHAGAEQYIAETLDLYGPDLLQADIPLKGAQELLRMVMEGQIAIDLASLAVLGVEDDVCGLPIDEVYRTQ